jgi:hypothetical protein
MLPRRTFIALLALLFVGGVAVQAPTAAATERPALLAPADKVFITASGDKYHRDGCRHLRKSKIETTRGEAEKAGKTACKVCKP